MSFARQYYEDFPKVALGHYPPGYYALAALVLLAWDQPQVLLVLQALLVAGLSMLVFWVGRRMLRERAALAAALLCAGFPITLKLSQLIMADLLLACLCLLSVEIWARFLEKPRAGMALLFGFTAAAAILTKGSGLALALIPAVSLVGAGRWALLKKPAFWLAGLPVVVMAGPWMLYSTGITREGMVSTSALSFAWGALKYYPFTLSSTFGLATAMIALGGLAVWLGFTQVKVQPDVRRTALLGLLLGTVLIMLLIPAGYSSRYFMPLVPVVALLAVSFFEVTLRRTRLAVPACFSLALLVWMQAPGLLVKNVSGYRSAVLKALDGGLPELQSHWLVCADARGEGAVIASAAFALKERSPSPLRIHRGTKALAKSDWLGRDYQATFGTADEMRAWLDKAEITHVFIDYAPQGTEASAHEKLLIQALADLSSWTLEHETATTRPHQAAPGRLAVFVRRSL
ncbi:glycosyltransferase family 39 protein [Prosthecobacter sp. SYSU 5D2]|uniref:ArnT family glycosyltransferase n=1 Tax=Prosthecobacter sp. SYSU 5D2 TaxID=3134134 RepID=UPI0031FE5716